MKLKLVIDRFIRAIIAEEVRGLAKEISRLQFEKQAFDAQLRVFETHLRSLNDAVKYFIENSDLGKTNLELRQHCREMEAKLAEVQAAFTKLHPVAK